MNLLVTREPLIGHLTRVQNSRNWYLSLAYGLFRGVFRSFNKSWNHPFSWMTQPLFLFRSPQVRNLPIRELSQSIHAYPVGRVRQPLVTLKTRKLFPEGRKTVHQTRLSGWGRVKTSLSEYPFMRTWSGVKARAEPRASKAKKALLSGRYDPLANKLVKLPGVMSSYFIPSQSRYFWVSSTPRSWRSEPLPAETHAIVDSSALSFFFLSGWELWWALLSGLISCVVSSSANNISFISLKNTLL